MIAGALTPETELFQLRNDWLILHGGVYYVILVVLDRTLLTDANMEPCAVISEQTGAPAVQAHPVCRPTRAVITAKSISPCKQLPAVVSPQPWSCINTTRRVDFSMHTGVTVRQSGAHRTQRCEPSVNH